MDKLELTWLTAEQREWLKARAAKQRMVASERDAAGPDGPSVLLQKRSAEAQQSAAGAYARYRMKEQAAGGDAGYQAELKKLQSMLSKQQPKNPPVCREHQP